ncbi:hypothetical protein BGZ63DRAFT_353097 [Mariannaea sp. PMI_226]|nr:hypothetical protein BGZ63DRAFT_353097 [Mariannaea sp. PMI_226]
MALWPFRRRSARKRPRSGTAQSDPDGGPPISPTDVAHVSKKKRRTEPPRPAQPTRTYSFEPGQQDSLPLDRERALLRKRDRNARGNNPRAQHETDNDGVWDRTPTLHPNNKSSKQRKDRKERREREAQIKAMVDFEPVRPAAEQWTSGRPMKKDTQKGGNTPFGRHRSTRNSDVSLPSPGSLHSSLSSDSELGAFTVSPLDALAPRPTLRYTRGPRWSPPPPPAASLQTSTQRRKLVVKEPIPEETMRAHKRIDSLADDLDASDLRELMERDQRRREKKKQKERARMERRLAKRAEEQRAEELEARNTGTPPPENLERGVMGRELVGLGIEPASTVVTSERKSAERRSADRKSTERKSTERKSIEQKSVEQRSTEQKPVQEPPSPMDIDTPRDDSFITRPSEDHPPSQHSGRLAGILRSVRSRSRSTLHSERDKMVSPPPDTIHEEPTRKNSHDSGSSTKGTHFNLRSLFRFGSKRQRDLVEEEQSSFSNTSREEMQAVAAAVRAKAQAQAQALARLEGDDYPIYLARKNSVPKRTRSRFREDLPELPISPPASRVQSPEPEPPVPALPQLKTKELDLAPGRSSAEGVRRTPSSVERACISPSPEAQMSVSLASIDSEGSWLSGNKEARRVAMRNSLRRANRLKQGVSDTPTTSTGEELMEDEYLSKLAAPRTSSKRETSDTFPSSEDDLDMKWGAVGTQPQMVNRMTMRSQEGLLDIDSENDSDSPTSPVSPSSDIADVQRARSVHLGKGHVRNFSAGSAKLLDISPRLSADCRQHFERK